MKKHLSSSLRKLKRCGYGLLAAVPLAFVPGCASYQAGSILKQLKDDPAFVHVRTQWGDITRSGGTNAVTVDPTGRVERK